MSHVQMVPLCPSKVPMRRPSSDRHRLADRSFAQLMRRSPSRLNLRQGRQSLQLGKTSAHDKVVGRPVCAATPQIDAGTGREGVAAKVRCEACHIYACRAAR